MSIKLNTTSATITAQGFTESVDLSSFHEDAIDAIVVYGLRRWFQDSINSQAKAARDDGETITAKWAKEAFESRLAQAVSGEITMRGSGTSGDPLDAYRLQVVRAALRNDPKSPAAVAYNAIASDDQKARREYLLTVATEHAKKVDPVAESLRAEDEKRKATVAGLDLAM